MKFLRVDSTITEVLEVIKTQIDSTKPGGFGVVVNEDGSIVGVISDSDIRRSFLENDNTKKNLLAKDLMKTEFIYIYDSELENSNFQRLTKTIQLRNILNKIKLPFRRD